MSYMDVRKHSKQQLPTPERSKFILVLELIQLLGFEQQCWVFPMVGWWCKNSCYKLLNCGCHGPRNSFSNTYWSLKLALRVVVGNVNEYFRGLTCWTKYPKIMLGFKQQSWVFPKVGCWCKLMLKATNCGCYSLPTPFYNTFLRLKLALEVIWWTNTQKLC